MSVSRLEAVAKTMQQQLEPLYGRREASLITAMCLEKLTGWSAADQKKEARTELSEDLLHTLQRYLSDLLGNRPVQYVLEEAWFQGMPFFVQEGVLIPRPETEELVEWVAAALKNAPAGETILDVGSGSGCIAISLAKKLPQLQLLSVDISTTALDIARLNSEKLGIPVNWQLLNFLDAGQRNTLPPCHCIVSNPPYIPLAEKANMQQQVVQFEPGLALFVPDDNALLFYAALADFTRLQLPGTLLFVEIHEAMAAAVTALFAQKGLTDMVVKKDMQGKERMIGAVNP